MASRGDMPCCIYVYKSQEQAYERLWLEYRIVIPHIELMKNVTKVACRCFKRKQKESRFTQKLIQRHDVDSDKEYILDIDIKRYWILETVVIVILFFIYCCFVTFDRFRRTYISSTMVDGYLISYIMNYWI